MNGLKYQNERFKDLITEYAGKGEVCILNYD